MKNVHIEQLIEKLANGSDFTYIRDTGDSAAVVIGDKVLSVKNFSDNEISFNKAFVNRKNFSDINSDRVIKIEELGDEDIDGDKLIWTKTNNYKSFSEYIRSRDFNVLEAISMIKDIALALSDCYTEGYLCPGIEPDSLFVKDGQIIIGNPDALLSISEADSINSYIGHIGYMAPEVKQSKKYSMQSDIYAVGMLFYTLFNNFKLPLKRDDLVIYPAEDSVCFSLNQILQFTCDPIADNRFQTYEEFIDFLDFVTDEISSYYESISSDGEVSIDTIFEISTISTIEKVALLGDKDVIRPSGIETSGDELPGIASQVRDEDDILSSMDKMPVRQDVNFSAVIPSKMIKDEISLINIVMYKEEFRSIVDELLKEVSGKEIKRKTKVAEGTEIKVVLKSEEVKIRDSRKTAIWNGEYEYFQFFINVPKNYSKTKIHFTAKVYFNGVLVTTLAFEVSCTSPNEEIRVNRSDITSAFISYDLLDNAAVLNMVKGMKMMCPDMDLFLTAYKFKRMDHDRLVKPEIDSRDLFCLVWSKNASENCDIDFEWRYALDVKEKNLFDVSVVDGFDLPSELKEGYEPLVEEDEQQFLPLVDGKVFLDTYEKKLLVDDTTKKLTNQQYNLLYRMAGNVDKVFGFDSIEEIIWDTGDDTADNYKNHRNRIKNIVFKTNELLEGTLCQIESVRGEGYKFSKKSS